MSASEMILIVDDNQDIFSVVKDALEVEGYVVMSAVNTAEAEALLNEEKFALIVCDIKMPDEDGIAFYDRISKTRNLPAFLFISGEVSVDNFERINAINSEGLLTKPFRVRELRERVRQIIG
jgi:DNA-binding response OmpR family regulator